MRNKKTDNSLILFAANARIKWVNSRQYIINYYCISYFNRTLLFLCALALVLSSCSDDFESRRNRMYGKEVEVNISIRNAGFGANSDITRSSTEAAKPITTSISLGEGLSLQATLEPDSALSRTRAGEIITFDAGTLIRIVAYPVGSTTPAGHVFIAADAIGSVHTTRGKITLAPGNYRFVAYAYYHPAHKALAGDTIEALIASKKPDIVIGNFPPDLDVLYGVTTQTVGVDSYVEIDIQHLYSRITEVKVNTTQMGGSYPVQTISDVAVVSYKGNLHLALDSVSRGDSISHAILPNSKWSPPAVVRSVADTCLVFPGSGTIVKVGTVQIDSRIFNEVSATFNTELQRGMSYTLHLNFKTDPMPTVDNPIAANTYVGAFWKAGEKGERVIHIPVSGSAFNPPNDAWRATVAWYSPGLWVLGSDGVVLAMGDSPDPNIRRSGYTPGNAESYPVSVGSSTINGVITNGAITFRIGLQKTYTPTTQPARYAVVLVSFGPDKSQTQRIFLRQCEGTDNISGISPHNAVKWSPYNLGNLVGPAFPTKYSNGGFVDYPSQAGFFYQSENPLTASYAPTGVLAVPIPSPTISTPFGMRSPCPIGYNLPTGNTDGTSELESLKTTGTGYPTDIKHVWGYYADGFFDRREIVNSGTTVATGDETTGINVAYIGKLVYHPDTYASLFLPAAGRRHYSNSSPANPGFSGMWWSRSPWDYSDNNSYYLESGSSVITGTMSNNYGLSVRCISDPSPLIDPANIRITTFTNVMYDFQHQTLECYVTGSNAPAAWQWKVSTSRNGTYNNIPGAIWPTYTVPAGFSTASAYLSAVNNELFFKCEVTNAAGASLTTDVNALGIEFIHTNIGYGMHTPSVGGGGTIRYLTIARAPHTGSGNYSNTISVALLNLGASGTGAYQEYMYRPDTGLANDAGDLGDYYQWGRWADGHQHAVWSKNSSHANDIAPMSGSYSATSLPVAHGGSAQTYSMYGQINLSNTAYYGNFIVNSLSVWGQNIGSNNYDLWGGTDNTRNGHPYYLSDWSPKGWTNNPCPDGWQVPSRYDLWDIYRGTGTDVPALGSPNPYGNYNNTWRWRPTANGAIGGVIITNSAGRKLFLPAAGYRYDNGGNLSSSGTYGNYWTSTYSSNTTAHSFAFSETVVNINSSGSITHANGYSIRCIRRTEP